ncbi:dimethylarginine dimethylaminohydrolase [Sphingorhabdus sp. IMCC26285]|uniref:Dimethylarginine dimethylaminohydrolase n=1 Tax=Sphingorhabdus profundilacus TaxID=2509718 RepID=A0A6I4LXS3_9SPHN|nr:arginine deiminase family protein [Sphingorhabdus profundilacus]MVZ96644.1 dimethylarginine dimethylaminohydrolase [Sphingorhabdus profundilacus]
MFDYSHAIVRSPAASVVAGLRAEDGPDPDFEALCAEHAAYVRTLEGLGLHVTQLAASEEFPDSIFVEDPALVFGEGAIVLNLAAPSRAGESALLAPVLEDRFEKVLHMQGPGHADGGDILVVRDRVLIGLSNRTDRAGAEELISLLARLGKKGEIAETPPGILHFKTGCSLIDEETVFALAPMVNSPAFAGMRVVEVPEGEEKAANKLRIRDSILMGAEFHKSRTIVESFGIPTIGLSVEQISRIDAGLSCMSLRWREKI